VLKASEKGLVEVEKPVAEKKVSNKEKKLELMLGPLKDDAEFKEFLAANNAIKSSKDNIWKNDISLGNLDEENLNKKETPKEKSAKNKKKKEQEKSNETGKEESEKTVAVKDSKTKQTTLQEDEDIDFENGRLFVRNLSYACKEDDLEKLFQPYAPLVEVSLPIDSFSKTPKGFAYIQCMFPEKAIKAFNELDGTVFQGRMLHIIPAKNKVENEAANKVKASGFKGKKEAELKKTAQSSHNWNTLFVSQDAVANIMSAKYNLEKSEIYDAHGSSTKKNEPSAAVKLAVGETQIVNDIRRFLTRNGVKLDAFSDSATERSKTCILVKNLPNGTTEDEVKELFDKNSVNGNIRKFVMPEYGVAALVEFVERQEARDAFKKLAYKKFKGVPIYLEWAPVDVFDGKLEEEEVVDGEKKKNEDGTDVVESEDDETEYEENGTIFVKNLNFDTSEETLKKVGG
jgi:multiple RNA-binding domain-containing protein 1